MFVRMAIVQMDFNISCYLGYPGGVWGMNKWTLQLTNSRCNESLREFQRYVGKNYCDILNDKLKCILNFCLRKKVNLVVFPEYSIPAKCLPVVKDFAKSGKMTIVAGSHYVEFLENEKGNVYREIGLKLNKKNDTGKSICPVFIYNPDNDNIKVEHVEKLTQTVLEEHVVIGKRWNIIEFKVGGRFYKFAIFLCKDFIDENDDHRNKIISKIISRCDVLDENCEDSLSGKAQIDFIVVPANTEKPEKFFLSKAKDIIKKHQKPVLFVNKACHDEDPQTILGNSQILCYLGKDAFNRTPFQENDTETSKIPSGEECIMIIDVNLDLQQHPGGPVNPKTLSKVQGVFPLVYKGMFELYERFYKDYFRESAKKGRESIIKKWRNNPSLARCVRNNFVLEEKISWMPAIFVFPGTRKRHSDVRDNLVDVLIFPGDIITIDEWRFHVFIACQRFLQGLRNSPIFPNLSNRDRNMVMNRMVTYDSEVDNIKGEIQQRRDKYIKLIDKEMLARLNPLRILSLPLPKLKLITEASSGMVDTELAKLILNEFAGGSTLEEEKKERVRNIINLVTNRRPFPSIKLGRYVLEKIDEYSLSNLKKEIRNYINEMDNVLNNIKNIFNNSMCKIKKGDSVLMFGYTKSTLSVLDTVPENDRKKVVVFVSECRSRIETEDGIKMAEKINKMGFSVHFIPDTAIVHHMAFDHPKKIKKVFMGCKVISIKNDKLNIVNSIGSAMVTEVAKKHNVKVYVVGGCFKIWPHGLYNEMYQKIIKEKRSSNALMPFSEMKERLDSNDIEIENYVSDVVLEDSIDWVVTEQCIVSAEVLREHFQEIDFSNELIPVLPEFQHI